MNFPAYLKRIYPQYQGRDCQDSKRHLFLLRIPTEFFDTSGLIIDIDRSASYYSRNHEKTRQDSFNLMEGFEASVLENRIFEDRLNIEAISAVKALELSNDMDIPVCKITDSIEGDCPNLEVSQIIMDEITSALAAGREIIIPEREFGYKLCFRWIFIRKI